MANESAGVRRDGLHAGRAEIYTYEAPWMIYACNWSVRATKRRERGTTASWRGDWRRRGAEAGSEGSRAVETRERGGERVKRVVVVRSETWVRETDE